MVKKDIQNIRSVKNQRKNNTSSTVGKLTKKKKFCLHHTSLFPKKKENSIWFSWNKFVKNMFSMFSSILVGCHILRGVCPCLPSERFSHSLSFSFSALWSTKHWLPDLPWTRLAGSYCLLARDISCSPWGPRHTAADSMATGFPQNEDPEGENKKGPVRDRRNGLFIT